MSFTFAGKQVYLATYVKERDPAFFYGGGPSIRGALLKKGVPETEIFYGIRAKGQWNPSKSTIRSATVFISKKWVDANVAAEFRFKYEKLEHVIAAQEALLCEKDKHIETLVFASGMKKK